MENLIQTCIHHFQGQIIGLIKPIISAHFKIAHCFLSLSFFCFSSYLLIKMQSMYSYSKLSEMISFSEILFKKYLFIWLDQVLVAACGM